MSDLDRTTLLHCRLEHQRWSRDLGEATADAVTRYLGDLNPEALAAVDERIVADGLLDRLAKDPTVLGCLHRARRWAIAEHETLKGHRN